MKSARRKMTLVLESGGSARRRRRQRVRAVKGKYAFLRTSSQGFARRK